MKLSFNTIIIIGIVIILIGQTFLFFREPKTQIITGSVTASQSSEATGGAKNFNFFTATTTTATSTNLTGGGGYFSIIGAKKVTMIFGRGGASGANTGTSRFKVEVSQDGTNWYPYNTLVLNQATTSYPNANSYVSISAATTSVTAQLRDLGWFAVRCIVDEVTDGEHSCDTRAEF